MTQPTDFATGVHHAMAFGFRYDAQNRVLRPVTKRLTIFENGASSTARDRWINAGYAPSAPDAENNDVTNAAAGGALSDQHVSWIHSIAIKRPSHPRVLPSSAVTNMGSLTPSFPRGGGVTIPASGTAHGVTEALFGAVMRTARLGIATYEPVQSTVQPPRFLPREDGVLWPIGGTLLAAPNTANNAAFKPNVMRFDFADQVSDVAVPNGLQSVRDGDYVVLDIDVCVKTALGTISDRDGVQYFDGINGEEMSKVVAWKSSFGGVNNDDDFTAENDDIKFAVSMMRRVRRSGDKSKIAVDDAVDRFIRELFRIERDRDDSPAAPVHKSAHPYR